MIEKRYQVVVVGGGISGVCAALAAARHGAKTALIQDRPVLGGNASSEIRMHICGADREGHRPNARETGIVEEILLENQLRNPQHSFSICDTILWEKTHGQENLDVYLNARFLSAEADNGVIRRIYVQQMTTEKDFLFTADIFIDATGDGMLAFQAGARVMHGREGKAVFGESLAPDVSDDYTMGNSLMFTARDMGRPVPFTAPPWAYHYTDADIPGHQDHHNGPVVEATSGYWWLELGGDQRDSLKDGEEIRDELLKTLYGVWDHLKNQDQGCENLALDWVGFLPGKRESRRIAGDYVLRQDDLTAGRIFDDDVAYGGWHLDLHPVGGFAAFGSFEEPSEEVRQLKQLKRLYGIPYRALLPAGMSNLLMAGRAISVSHIAFGSTRVMATCGVVGQAAGTAAALAACNGKTPREVDAVQLQETLMRDDCYLPEKHLPVQDAKARCSSCALGHAPEKALDGFLRAEENDAHAWMPDASDPAPWLEMQFAQPKAVKKVILRFDSNCSAHYAISISHWWHERIPGGVPRELVKDYALAFMRGGECVRRVRVQDNHLRFRVLELTQSVVCDAIRLEIYATYSAKPERVFQMEAYDR